MKEERERTDEVEGEVRVILSMSDFEDGGNGPQTMEYRWPLEAKNDS